MSKLIAKRRQLRRKIAANRRMLRRQIAMHSRRIRRMERQYRSVSRAIAAR